jgi:hypothetical protein
MRAEIDRLHDQEDVGKDRRCVDAEGDRGDIGSSRPFGEAVRLPRIKEVAEQDRDRDSRQDSPHHQALWQTAHNAKARDQKQVRKAAEKQPEEAVEVACSKPDRYRASVYNGNGRRHAAASF